MYPVLASIPVCAGLSLCQGALTWRGPAEALKFRKHRPTVELWAYRRQVWGICPWAALFSAVLHVWFMLTTVWIPRQTPLSSGQVPASYCMGSFSTVLPLLLFSTSVSIRLYWASHRTSKSSLIGACRVPSRAAPRVCRSLWLSYWHSLMPSFSLWSQMSASNGLGNVFFPGQLQEGGVCSAV